MIACSDEQRAIIEAPPDARILVLAGPGTGKTETVAHRLAWLLSHGVGPAEMAVLSFSRNAVKTLTNRIDALAVAGGASVLEELRHLAIRTFDSWTFRQLRLLNHSAGELLAGRNRYDANIALLVDHIRGDRRGEVRSNLGHLRHVIVDEFQDLSGARGALVLELLELLCPVGTTENGFTVLGDEDQAIYGFSLERSSAPEFAALTSRELFERLRTTRKAELREVRLTHNYRAEPRLARVVEAARSILSRRTSSATKLDALQKLVAHAKRLDQGGLEVTALSDGGRTSVGLLCRTNGEALRLAMALYGDEDTPPPIRINLEAGSSAAAVPAWIGATLGPCKGSQIDRARFDRIYGHLYGAKDAHALVAALEIPGVGIAWSTLKRIAAVGGGADAVDLGMLRERLVWPDQLPDDASLHRKSVTVTTVHQSKGMEYDTVGVHSSPHNEANEVRDQQRSADEEREEANVLFVAISRAARRLGRIDPKGMYPLFPKSFANESRSRWNQWRKGWLALEVGLSGDIDTASFVATGLHGSDAKVKELQDLMAIQAASLPGRKVVLCKTALSGKPLRFVYNIHLQTDGEPGLLLGRTTGQWPHDVSEIVSPKGFSLPKTFYNARVADVVTYTRQADEPGDAAEPWATSGLWIGVTLHGLASGKTFPRRS
jgi:DNA helicase II / ATP-dependent DNA helicase PcrA